jgi:hypothetical protein
MAAELIMVNPRARKRRRVTRARRNPRRAMTPLQRKYFGPKRRSRVTRVARNPVSRRSRRRHHRSIRRYQRNPTLGGYARRARSMIGENFVGKTLLPSAVGGAGALGLDVALAVLPLPESLKSGTMNIVTRIAGAIGIGMLARMVMGPRFGEQAMAGALTVTFYDGFKQALTTYAPSVPLSAAELGWVNPAMNVGPMGVYLDNRTADVGNDGGMGSYVSGDDWGN